MSGYKPSVALTDAVIEGFEGMDVAEGDQPEHQQVADAVAGFASRLTTERLLHAAKCGPWRVAGFPGNNVVRHEPSGRWLSFNTSDEAALVCGALNLAAEFAGVAPAGPR